MNKDHIFLLGKVYGNKKYAEDFLEKGLFICNTLKYFKDYEDEHNNNIGDRFEGAGIRLKSDSGAKISIDGIDVDFKEAHFHSNKHLMFNAFCMYAPNVNEEAIINSQFVKDLISIQEDAENLGEHFVVIVDVQEFINRVKSNLDSLNYKSRMHCVDYEDLSGSFDIPIEQIGFIKDKSYSHQKEFRILIERDNPDYEPLFLQIGSLKDIGGLIPVNQFNENFQIKLLDEPIT